MALGCRPAALGMTAGETSIGDSGSGADEAWNLQTLKIPVPGEKVKAVRERRGGDECVGDLRTPSGPTPGLGDQSAVVGCDTGIDREGFEGALRVDEDVQPARSGLVVRDQDAVMQLAQGHGGDGDLIG